MSIHIKKATAAIQLGYNTLLGFTGVAIFVALSSKHFAEAAALAALFIVIMKNSDIERWMAFGPSACLPKTNNELAIKPTEREMTAITGNYVLNLIFYNVWAFIALLVAKKHSRNNSMLRTSKTCGRAAQNISKSLCSRDITYNSTNNIHASSAPRHDAC